MRDDLNLDSTFVYESTGQAGQSEALPVTLPMGTIFVSGINGLSGSITNAGGSSGFSYSAAGSTLTLVSPLTTKGDLYTHNGTNGIRRAVGADDAMLVADATQASGLNWIAASTGWNAPTGTLARGTYAAYVGQTVSNPPTQAEMQALDDAVKLMSQTLAAALTDLRTQKRFKA